MTLQYSSGSHSLKKENVRKKISIALAGNWTRASRVAGENSTTEPPMPSWYRRLLFSFLFFLFFFFFFCQKANRNLVLQSIGPLWFIHVHEERCSLKQRVSDSSDQIYSCSAKSMSNFSWSFQRGIDKKGYWACAHSSYFSVANTKRISQEEKFRAPFRVDSVAAKEWILLEKGIATQGNIFIHFWYHCDWPRVVININTRHLTDSLCFFFLFFFFQLIEECSSSPLKSTNRVIVCHAAFSVPCSWTV